MLKHDSLIPWKDSGWGCRVGYSVVGQKTLGMFATDPTPYKWLYNWVQGLMGTYEHQSLLV